MQGPCACVSNLDFILQTSENLCHLLSQGQTVLEEDGSALGCSTCDGGREAHEEAGVAVKARRLGPGPLESE